jgi:hypothetical protein
MPTFIDESGDAGPGAKSPQFFRLTAVWFETFEHTESYLEAVAGLKRRLKLSDSFEFHFADIGHDHRMAFYEVAVEHPFGFVASSFDKGISRRGLKKQVIYERTIRGLVS